jgi:hypothetical protein
VRTDVHPSVASWNARFPRDTVWAAPLGGRFLFEQARLLLAMVLLVTTLGALLQPSAGSWAGWLMANADAQRWQVDLLASTAAWRDAGNALAHPGYALLLDLALIGVYATLLAPWVCRAFARHAGLIQLGHRPSRWLNVLGWALPAAVGADLLENTFSAAALVALSALPAGDLADWSPPIVVAWGLRLMVCAASLAKWTALAGVVGLIATAWFRRHHR